jgi:MFS family permease
VPPAPPDPPRARAIAWSLAVTQTIGYGVLFYAYAVVTLPMEAELGFSRADTSGAFSLGLLLAGLAAWPIGRLVDRHGARGLLTIGSLAGGAAVAAWSYVTTLAQLYLVQAAIGLILAAVTYEVAFAVIARWFPRERRIHALLIVTTLAGLASTIFVPLTQALVDGVGWRAALRVLAATLWIGTVPLHAWVVRRAPDHGSTAAPGAGRAEASVSARDAWRRGPFWWLTSAFALDRMIAVAIGAHAVPLLLERGHPPALVATVAGSIGVLQVAGRLVFAPATRHASLALLTVATFGVRAASLGAVAWLPGLAGLIAFAGLYGLSNGAATLARAGLVAETFGPRHYGAINGSMTTAVALSQTVAPLAVGAARVATGDYQLALWALLGLALMGGLAVEVPRRRGRLEGPTA